jgi:RNA polymerase sigma-70 factor, ECF subfamily
VGNEVKHKGDLMHETINDLDMHGNRNETRMNEAMLLRRAIAGDQAALEVLFAQNNRALYQTALRLLGNPEDAEDALQEGMLAAYRNLRRFEGRSQFSTWLTRIVINAALMRRRSRRTHAAVSLDEWTGEDQAPTVERFADHGPSPEELYASYELNERLRENLEGLSPLLRRAFELRELAGLTADEAAKTLGVSRNTLKARLWRARHQLAARLGEVLRRHNQTSRTSLVCWPGIRSHRDGRLNDFTRSQSARS